MAARTIGGNPAKTMSRQDGHHFAKSSASPTQRDDKLKPTRNLDQSLLMRALERHVLERLATGEQLAQEHNETGAMPHIAAGPDSPSAPTTGFKIEALSETAVATDGNSDIVQQKLTCAAHAHAVLPQSEETITPMHVTANHPATSGTVNVFVPPLEALTDAVVSPLPHAFEERVRHCMAAGMSLEQFVSEVVVPLMKALGEGWAQDHLSSGQVSIGSARMQIVLERYADLQEQSSRLNLELDPFLETEDASLNVGHPPAAQLSALLSTLGNEQHRMGLLVLTRALENLGWCVTIARDENDMWAALKKRRYDCLGLSIGPSNTVAETTRQLRKVRRQALNGNMTVMIGGMAILQNWQSFVACSADIIATDMFKALEDLQHRMALITTQPVAPNS